jgi:hypothetical protein
MKRVLLEMANACFVTCTDGHVLGTKEQKIVLNVFNYIRSKNTEKIISLMVSENIELTVILRVSICMEGINKQIHR